MTATLIIAGITCALMILSILFFPKLKIGKIEIDAYWPITLSGAAAMLISGKAELSTVGKALIADSAINPLKILVLFISMTVLSIFLDEVGFFSYLASVTLKRAKSSQFALFLYLYLIVSVLTVFTSNDIIILTFTPFICYFAKNAKISPIPYLFAEFIAANTWSMALIIGNPTNIYLATANGIGFVDYFLKMILPTLGAGIVSFGILLLLFHKKLSEKIEPSEGKAEIKDKPLLVIGLVHLSACTLLLAVSSYIGFEMWYISLGFAVSLFVCTLVCSAVRKERPAALGACLARAPWQLIPFVLSMFVLILALSENGVTARIETLFGESGVVFKYGFASLFTANFINNIPMSVLFSSVTEMLSGTLRTEAVLASVVGSNLGAFLTPIGALAGIMWSSILKTQHVKFSFADFIKDGAIVALPSALTALGVLALIV